MDNKEILVALAGNPNSGKTSLFNSLVGANQKVGNWPGVTVHKYEGVTTYKGYKIRVIDLPGTYSLTVYSPEERAARNFILEKKPDVVVNVVDTTNLERNLYLTTQLIDLKQNTVVALNMFDEVEKQGIQVDYQQLERLLGPHFIPTSAVKKTRIENVLEHIVDIYTGKIEIKKNKLAFVEYLEEKIEGLTKILSSDKELTEKYDARWLAIKLLVNDKEVYKYVKEFPVWIKVNHFLTTVIEEFEREHDSDPELLLREERLSFIRGAITETVTYPKKKKKSVTEAIDNILINRITGLPIFAFFMWVMFQLTFTIGEYPMLWLEAGFGWLGDMARQLITYDLAESIIVDGVIAGVGGVVVFLPNIVILFFFLALFEGTGYMARAAFVIDKVMHKVGLHGKSFIPMITGFGCSVPAFLATRTLKNESDRITTLLIIPFMSCSAKFPVYILIIGSFFPAYTAGNILFGVYLFGVLVALLSAKLFKTVLFKGESEPFVMELPPYRMPSLKSLLFQMWFKASMYLRKAGTVILAGALIIWLASNFPKDEELTNQVKDNISRVEQSSELSESEKQQEINQLKTLENKAQLKHSIAGRFGELLEPVLQPLGFDWRISIAIVSGVAAKEIVVSTMGTIFAVGNAEGGSSALREQLRSEPDYNAATGLALLIFVLLYIPCFASSIVFHKEAGRWRWTGLFVGYTIGIAWIMAFIVYNAAIIFI